MDEDGGGRQQQASGVPTEVAKKLKALERENREPQPVANNVNRLQKPTRS